MLMEQILSRGAHPDDRDAVTDMTLLMYACKSGAAGVGNVDAATRVVKRLLEMGASLDSCCRWTDMNPLHYAAFFDVAPIVTTLLMASSGIDVDRVCQEYEYGSALHIAAANLSLEAAKALLGFGADLDLTDDLERRPYECVPELSSSLASLTMTVSADETDEVRNKLLYLLKAGLENYKKKYKEDQSVAFLSRVRSRQKTSVSGRAVMRTMGLKIDDRVLVHGSKLGTLRYLGMTNFATGLWAGVELDDHGSGKNDGSVDEVVYFVCSPNSGVFVPPNRICKVGKKYRSQDDNPLSASQKTAKTKVNHGKVDLSKVSSKLSEAMAQIADRGEIRVGDRVFVTGLAGDRNGPNECSGIVRFVGPVDFVDDDNTKWFGVELDEPLGRHDGTVQGVRYFASNIDRGIFVTESKISKLAGRTWPENRMNIDTLEQVDGNLRVNTPLRPLRRSLSMQHRELQQPPALKETRAVASPIPSVTARSNCSYSVRESGEKLLNLPNWQTVGTIQTNKFQMRRSPQKKFLQPGETVICINSKQMAVIKYVGRTDFAPGIWVGVELKEAKGKHDGTVQGRRYFNCKPGHGLMIRPSSVSVHGILGDQLLKPESEYPF